MLKITIFPFTVVGPGQTAFGRVGFTTRVDASYTAAITADIHSIFKVTKIYAVRPTLEWSDSGGGSGDGVKGKPQKPVKVIVDELVGSTDGATPLKVLAGDKIAVEIQMVCPNNPDDTYYATLTVTSSISADTTTVQLSVATGQIEVKVLQDHASAAPGSTATWLLFVHSLAGPATYVTLTPEVGDFSGISIPPPIGTFLPRRGSRVLALNGTVQDITPPGSYVFNLGWGAFGTGGLLPFSLKLTVTDAPVFVTSTQPSNFAMVQGSQLEFDLDVRLAGSGTAVDLTIDPTPPGLTCTFLDGQNKPIPKFHIDFGSKASVHLPVRLTLAQDASGTASLSFPWSAYAGAEQGKVNFGITIVPAETKLHADVVTGGLSGLGGFVDMKLRFDGSYTVHVHMFNTSKVTGYDYQIRAICRSPNGMMIVANHSGHVGAENVAGTAAEDDFAENGIHPWVQMNWDDAVNVSMAVSHEYSASGGILGELETLAEDALIIMGGGLAAGATGTAFGTMIAVTKETEKVFGGIGGGVVVIAGVVVFAVEIAAGAAPATALMCATVAGVALGAVTDAMIKQLPISPAEYDFANSAGDGAQQLSHPEPPGGPRESVCLHGRTSANREALENESR